MQDGRTLIADREAHVRAWKRRLRYENNSHGNTVIRIKRVQGRGEVGFITALQWMIKEVIRN